VNFSRRDLRGAEGKEVTLCCFSEWDKRVYEEIDDLLKNVG
jgi:hypothetical protein